MIATVHYMVDRSSIFNPRGSGHVSTLCVNIPLVNINITKRCLTPFPNHFGASCTQPTPLVATDCRAAFFAARSGGSDARMKRVFERCAAKQASASGTPSGGDTDAREAAGCERAGSRSSRCARRIGATSLRDEEHPAPRFASRSGTQDRASLPAVALAKAGRDSTRSFSRRGAACPEGAHYVPRARPLDFFLWSPGVERERDAGSERSRASGLLPKITWPDPFLARAR